MSQFGGWGGGIKERSDKEVVGSIPTPSIILTVNNTNIGCFKKRTFQFGFGNFYTSTVQSEMVCSSWNVFVTSPHVPCLFGLVSFIILLCCFVGWDTEGFGCLSTTWYTLSWIDCKQKHCFSFFVLKPIIVIFIFVDVDFRIWIISVFSIAKCMSCVIHLVYNRSI